MNTDDRTSPGDARPPTPGIAVEISDTQAHLAIDPAALAALVARRARGAKGVARGVDLDRPGRRRDDPRDQPPPPRPRLADRRDQLPPLRARRRRSWPASWSSPPRWPRRRPREVGRRPLGRAGALRGPRFAPSLRLRRPDRPTTRPRCGGARARSWPGEGSDEHVPPGRPSPSGRRRGSGRVRGGRAEPGLDARPGPAGPGAAPGLGRADEGPADLFAEPAGGRLRARAAIPSGPTTSPTTTSATERSAEALAVLTGLLLAALLGGAGRPVAPAPGRSSSCWRSRLVVGVRRATSWRASSARSSPRRVLDRALAGRPRRSGS